MKLYTYLLLSLLIVKTYAQELKVLDVDKAYTENKIYRRYDSLKVIINAEFPNGIDCEFHRGCVYEARNRQDQYFEDGNIAFLNTDSDKMKLGVGNDTITVKWRDPKIGVKKYYLVAKNFNDEIIDFNVSNDKQILIDFKDYKYKIKKKDSIIITVISEDCRSSSRLAIVR